MSIHCRTNSARGEKEESNVLPTHLLPRKMSPHPIHCWKQHHWSPWNEKQASTGPMEAQLEPEQVSMSWTLEFTSSQDA